MPGRSWEWCAAPGCKNPGRLMRSDSLAGVMVMPVCSKHQRLLNRLQRQQTNPLCAEAVP